MFRKTFSKRVRTGVALIALALSSPAFAEKITKLPPARPAPNNEHRHALVIGNSDYKSAPLRNPVNDARAIAQALAQTGFAVTLLEDATQGAMRRTIRDFGDAIEQGGVGLFYFAGHGLQVRGRNFLVPVNADIQRENEIEDQAVDANLVLSKMDSARNTLNLMILDACRNNPFARAFRSMAQGLAQMDAPSGTLVAFATAPGSVASDGDGEHGVYTKHLLREINRPGLPIEQMFKQVRIGVTRETADRQIPWESSSLKGDFYFLPAAQAAGAGAPQALSQSALLEATRAAEERASAERAEFQRRMEKLVEDALAKQREALAGQSGAQAGAAPATPPAQAPAAAGAAPAPAARPAPAQPALAVVAPAGKSSGQGAASGSAVPRPGDSWEYSYHDKWKDRRLKRRFEVTQVAGKAIHEVVSGDELAPLAFTHSDATYVAGPGLPQFSPYLLAFREAGKGKSFDEIGTVQVADCQGSKSCVVSAKVLATERVTVPAGTFDAVKIEVWIQISNSAHSLSDGSTFSGATLVYWFAPQAKRIVKAEGEAHGTAATMSNFAFELLTYKLN